MSAPPSAKKLRVIVVDDNGAILAAVKRMLETRGHAVQAFSDALQAGSFAMDHGQDFDVLVTDVVMAKLMGQQVAKWFRCTNPFGRVVFMSGWDEEALQERTNFDPSELYLTKPFSKEELLAAVEEIVDAESDND